MFNSAEERIRARIVINRLNKILDEQKIVTRSKHNINKQSCDDMQIAANALEKYGFLHEAATLGYLARNPAADIFCDEYTRAAMRAAVNVIKAELDKNSGENTKQTFSL